MANIMDYLDWRGDLTFAQSPFNEVDNLILAVLSYVDMSGSVQGLGCRETTTIRELSEQFWVVHTEEEIDAYVSFTLRSSAHVLKKLEHCPRFSELKLSHYVNRIDYETQKQFSAVVVELDETTLYVAFRGTDETILGWKEDFNMSFMDTVPSQLDAVEYLETVLEGTQKNVVVGGHSKGGNLAVYASVKCKDSIKKQIIAVYNNDGPGFNETMLADEHYQQMVPLIYTIVPQSSVIGMLLEHEEPYAVVESKQVGLMQHDATSWEVFRNHFVYLDDTTKQSQMINCTIKAWLNGLTIEERSTFIDTMYNVLCATEAKTLDDLTKDRMKKMNLAIKSLNSQDTKTKAMIMRIIRALMKEGNVTLKRSFKKGKTVEQKEELLEEEKRITEIIDISGE